MGSLWEEERVRLGGLCPQPALLHGVDSSASGLGETAASLGVPVVPLFSAQGPVQTGHPSAAEAAPGGSRGGFLAMRGHGWHTVRSACPLVLCVSARVCVCVCVRALHQASGLFRMPLHGPR